jgi:hypothetical protein
VVPFQPPEKPHNEYCRQLPLASLKRSRLITVDPASKGMTIACTVAIEQVGVDKRVVSGPYLFPLDTNHSERSRMRDERACAAKCSHDS